MTRELERLLEFAREWVGLPVMSWLRHPLLLGEVALLSGILMFAWLRSVGAPLQFLSEKPGKQLGAGFAATLTVAHAFLVVYLMEAPCGLRAVTSIVWFAIVWGAVLFRTAYVRLRSKREADAPQAPDALGAHARAEYPKLTEPLCPVYEVEDAERGTRSELGRARSVEVEPWPFLAGAAIACSLAAAVLVGAELCLARLDSRLASVWPVFASTSARPNLHVVALLALGVVSVQLFVLRRAASPANALCSLLCIGAGFTGASSFWLGGAGPALLVLLLLLGFAGRERFAIRVSDLESLYAAPPAYPPPLRTKDAPALLADRLAMSGSEPPGWSGELGDKRPLLLVCASGGGIRAAAWTAGILGRLAERVPHFPESTLMITGASGGMVGASFWLAWQRQRAAGRTNLGVRALFDAVTREAISATSRDLVLHDIPAALRKIVNRGDRGSLLESRWERSAAETLGCTLRVPLRQFKDSAAQGLLPTLVFSPVIVEDGRRLLIGNLRLPTVCRAESIWVSTSSQPGPARGLASESAYHAADLFGDRADDITLLTAARLSASFPYVSPAVVLPTTPRRRVVDAGYYDDYGVGLVASWLREALEHHADWLARHVSTITVLQIRDEPSPLDVTSVPGRSRGSAFARGLEGLTSPIEALLSTHDSSMRLRNDAELEAVMNAYERRLGPASLATQVYELKRGLSLNWYLAESEIRLIEGQLYSNAMTRKIDEVAQRVTHSLERPPRTSARTGPGVARAMPEEMTEAGELARADATSGT